MTCCRKMQCLLLAMTAQVSTGFLNGVVLCKQRIVLALDSLPGLPVKPTVLPAVEKIESFLQCIGYSVDIKQWFFSSNKPGEIP